MPELSTKEIRDTASDYWGDEEIVYNEHFDGYQKASAMITWMCCYLEASDYPTILYSAKVEFYENDRGSFARFIPDEDRSWNLTTPLDELGY